MNLIIGVRSNSVLIAIKNGTKIVLQGLDIPRDGIVLPLDHADRSTGEAFVKFASGEAAEKALGKHKEKIGHRYRHTGYSPTAFPTLLFLRCFPTSGFHPFRESRNSNSLIVRLLHCSQTIPFLVRYIEIFQSSREEFVDRSMFETYPHDPYSRFGPAGPFSHPGPFPPKMRFNPMQSARPSPYDRFSSHRPAANFGPVFGYGGIGMGNRGPPPPGRRNQIYAGDFDRGFPIPPRPGYGFPPSPPPGSAGHTDLGPGRHMVHMRGLPFRASELDVQEFFKPLRPIRVQILIDNIGRPSGEANVEFATHDEATKAMNKDKANMGKSFHFAAKN